ncbi:MAG: PAS domain S-box protein [Anaerolineales bacterium]|nr:PAS domain S-box protein [Anaerolineales bacterium]
MAQGNKSKSRTERGKAKPAKIGADKTKRKGAKQIEPPIRKETDLLERVSDGFIACDAEMNYVYVNRRGAELLGRKPEDMIGRNFFTEFPEAKGSPFANAYAEALKTQKPIVFEDYYAPWGRWFENRIYPSKEGLSIFFTEVTERKRAEHVLRESEEKFRDVFEAANVGKSITLPTGEISVNRAFADLLGYSRDELAGKTWQELTPPDDVESTSKIIATLLNGEKDSVRFNKRYIHKDGSIIWADVSTVMRRGEDGKPLYFISTIVDVTARKQAENDLIEREAQLKFSQRIAHVGHWTWDIRENRVMWSDEMKRIFGLDPDMVEGDLNEVIARSIHPDDQEKVNAANISVIADGKPTPLEYRVIRSDGSVRMVWAEAGEAITDNDGKVVKLSGIVQDITDRKRVEEELRESEAKLRRLIEQSADGIMLTDEQGRLVEWNRGQEEMTGLGRSTIQGKPLWEVQYENMPEERRTQQSVEQLRTIQLKFFENGHLPEEFRIQEQVINRPDGTQRIVQTHVFPIRTDKGFKIGAITRDITERKQVEDKVQRQLAHLSALREIDQAIASTGDMHVSLNILLSQTMKLLKVDAAAVLLVNESMFTLEYEAGTGFRTKALRTASLKLGESYAGKAALKRQLMQIPNLAYEPDNIFLTGFLKGEDFVSYYGAPLIVKGKVVGVFEIFNRSIVERDAEWLDFFVTLAEQAALAIDNARAFENMQRSNMELMMAYDATIAGWSHAMDLRDKETEGHTQRVTDLTLRLAERIGISQSERLHMRRGALLHDIGKLGVPDSILVKPGKLTDEEWVIMKHHPTYAFEMLMPISYLRPAIDIPYSHHEKWDGTGYPRGLKGEDIPLSARIFAVVDVWDAVTNDRPYRPAWTREKTIEYIKEQSGRHFDPKVVEEFLKMIEQE